MDEKPFFDVNLSVHDVLLSARKNHPAIAIDGLFLDGVQELVFVNKFENGTCDIRLTFNERIANNPYPLNDINLLEKLFGPQSNGQSLRDSVMQLLEDDD